MESQDNRPVVVVDIKMRFWSMVIFMVKWVIASIPALIILAIIWTVFVVVVQHLSGGFFWQGRFL